MIHIKRWRLITLGLVCCLSVGLGRAWLLAAAKEEKRSGHTVDNFQLLDQRGRVHELYRNENARAVVLVTVGNGCPIVRQSIGALKELRAQFEEAGVIFLLLNANAQDARESVVAEAQEFGIDFPILQDQGQTTARMLGATRTAEVFAVNPKNWTVFYEGAIDDRLGYGTQKVRGVRHYLEEALREFTENKPVTTARTQAKGCAITFEGANKKTVSYARDVAPILREHCVSCHSPGGIGPFAMTNYTKLKGMASTIRETILERRMPPWHADRHYGAFANDRSLSDQEMRTLLSWIEQGAARGSGEDPLATASGRQTQDWPLGKPDLIVAIPSEETIPATGLQPYRYFTVEPPLTSDVWVRAAVIRPGNNKVLHHCLTFLKYPETLKDKQPKYERGAGGYFSGYVPGTLPAAFPEGTGKFLPKGSQVVFQMHYTPTGKEEKDRTELGLYFLPAPPAMELQTRAAVQGRFEIPPGALDLEARASYRLKKDSLLYSMSPHMHLRGSRFLFEAVYQDGTRETLLSVPRYDFNWQTLYELAVPKKLPAGTRVVCTGAFDNSPRNPANPDATKLVHWGDQSFDEMFIGYFNFVELPDKVAAADGERLAGDGRR